MVYQKRIKLAIVVVGVFIFLTSFVLAETVSDDLHVNIQTTYANGSIQAGTYDFIFNISSSSDCSNVVYSDSATITTDNRGVVSRYLVNTTLDYSSQYWLCYYLDGTLKNASKLVNSPYAFYAQNVSVSGIMVDSNLDMGSNNVSTGGWFKGLFNWTVLTNWFSFDGAILSFNETKLNDTISSKGLLLGFNSTYNATYAAGSGGDNASWNQTYATSLYADTKWGYNETTIANTYTDSVNTSQSSWIDAVFLKIADMFTKSEISTMISGNKSDILDNNASWTSTYNATYAAIGGDNVTWNESRAGDLYSDIKWGYNMTYDGSTYNATYDATTGDNTTWKESRANTLYSDIKWGYNMTYDGSTYNATYAASGADNVSWNQTYATSLYSDTKWGYNQTYSGSTYNATYDATTGDNASWNQSYADTAYYGSGDSATFSELNASSILRVGSATLLADSSGMNITGIVNFGGSWQDGGATITNGNVFAQALYVYNVTSLNVDSLQINGSISPGTNGTFNNTFDLGISGTNVWRYGYFGTDVVIGGESVKKWMYNQTYSGSTYNATYAAISGDNATWNESRAGDLYSDIKWGYNMTYSGSTYNATYLSTYNATYAAITGDNATWNESRAGDLYADIKWGYNMTYSGSTYNATYLSTYNASYLSTYNATYASNTGDNASWNQTGANGLYSDIKWGYNMTYSGSTYNASYDTKNTSQWLTVGSDIYYSVGSASNVGIGNSTPEEKLHVQGNLLIGNASTDASPYKLIFSNYFADPSGGAPNKIDLWGNEYGLGVSAGDLDYFSQVNHNFYAGTLLTMTVNSSGVGIMEANPTQSLHVNGTFNVTDSTGAGILVNDDGNVVIRLG